MKSNRGLFFSVVILLFLAFGLISANPINAEFSSSTKNDSISVLAVSNVNWTEGSFIPNYETGYAEYKEEDFYTNITSSEIHVFETSNSHYHLFAGVYALFPTIEDTLNVTFDGRATSSRHDQIIMGAGIIDPSTMEYLGAKRLYDYQDSGISSPYDTGYNNFSYYFNTTGYAEVYLFFYYIDATSAFWNQNIYVKNLIVDNVSVSNEEYTSVPPYVDSTPPSITGMNDFVMEEFQSGVFVDWIVDDESPLYYKWIFVNGILEAESELYFAEGPMLIGIQINSLTFPGVYNYTLVVSDIHDNYAIDTVIVTITPYSSTNPTTTTPINTTPNNTLIVPFYWLSIPIAILIIAELYRRKVKK